MGKKFLMFKVYHLSLETKQGYPQRSCPLILYWNLVFKRINFESKEIFAYIILYLENINQEEIIRYYKVGILKYISCFYKPHFKALLAFSVIYFCITNHPKIYG